MRIWVFTIALASTAQAKSPPDFKPVVHILESNGKQRSIFLRPEDRPLTDVDKRLGVLHVNGFRAGPFSCGSKIERERRVKNTDFLAVTVTCVDPKKSIWKLTRICVDNPHELIVSKNVVSSILSMQSGEDRTTETALRISCYAMDAPVKEADVLDCAQLMEVVNALRNQSAIDAAYTESKAWVEALKERGLVDQTTIESLRPQLSANFMKFQDQVAAASKEKGIRIMKQLFEYTRCELKPKASK